MKISNWIILIFVALMLTSCAAKKEEKLEIVKVTRGNIESSIPATGTVMPRNRLELKPPVAGRIESVLVVEGQAVAKGEILAWMSSMERAALIDAARSKGAEEVKRWEEMYNPTPVMAPINGFIIQKSVEPGQTFTSNDVVLVMADHLIVKAQIDETDIGRIKLGQGVQIILDAYPKDAIKGKVEHIAYESKVISNVTVYEVDVVPDYIPAFFRAGMSATVNFSQSQKDSVLLVPVKAAKKRGKLTYVFKVNGEGKDAKPVQVEAGLEDSSNIEIISGLNEGDSVAIPTTNMLKLIGGGHGGPMNLNPFSSGQNRSR
jgi:macrolide-specific efflux system membrane fusion protein